MSIRKKVVVVIEGTILIFVAGYVAVSLAWQSLSQYAGIIMLAGLVIGILIVAFIGAIVLGSLVISNALHKQQVQDKPSITTTTFFRMLIL